MIVCPWKDLGRYAAVIPGLEEAVAAVNALTDFTPATYPLSGGNRIMVQQGVTKPVEGAQCEVHREYLDIQYVVKGQEVVGWAPTETLALAGEFNAEKDKGMYAGPVDLLRIGAGYCYVVFPEDAHMPNRHIGAPNEYVKVVVKLKV